MTDGRVEATVAGSDSYRVTIEAASYGLRASCSCPFFRDRFDICKHIWAVVLAAEDRGLPLLPPGVAPNRVVLEPMDDESYDDDYDPDDSAMPPAPLQGLRTPSPTRGQKQKTSPWQQRLRAVGDPHAAYPLVEPPAARELLYVIDVPVSAAARSLVVELMTRTRKTNGEWAKPKAARIRADELHTLRDEQDRRLLERLVGARHDYGAYGSAYAGATALARMQLGDVLARDLLPEMAGTGRCFARAPVTTTALQRPPTQPLQRWGWAAPARAPQVQTELLPLEPDDRGPWRFSMTIRRDGAKRGYVIEGHLARDGEQRALGEPLLITSGGLVITRTHLARLEDGGASIWLAALRQGPMEVPDDDRVALIDAMLAEPPPVAELPSALRVEIESTAPQPVLQLHPSKHQAEHLEATLAWDYGGLIAAASHATTLIRNEDATRIIRRDPAAEQAAYERLMQLGFRRGWSYSQNASVPHIPAHHLPRVVRMLLAEHWRVEAKGFVYRTAVATALRVTSGIDWFDLEGHADYGPHRVALPALLAALRRGDGFVRLGDGSLGLLPEDWLRKQGLLSELGTPDGDVLRFKPSQVALLDALLAQQPSVNVDEAFASARARLATFEGITAADPPASFTGTLRGYQREGLGWLLFLRQFGFGGCLADDMGLGKTVMVLALLAQVHAKGAPSEGERLPSLVVAPRSLIFNWQHEAARFTPHLRVLDYTGTGRTTMRDEFGGADIVLTTYGTLRRDAAHLAEYQFDYAVLDESTAIKNAASASAKATRLLRARQRLALSGTPIENHLGELWSLFEFLNPGMLGASAAFQGMTSRSMDEAAVAAMARGLRPFMLRRTKEQVAAELPPRTEQTLYCELERSQRTLYDELRAHYRRTLLDPVTQVGLGRTKLQVLEALLRLRQAACHPGLVDKKRSADASAKLDVLVPRIAEAVEEGHKTLVFSQFTSLLEILRRRLDADGIAYEYLDGRTRDRQARVERFQTDDSCRLFLVSLKAGGVGLNLTAAEYVFLLDPWWNPAVEAQAIDRAHRIGQSRRVFAYRLIAKDTVEERVLELQQHKRKLADAVLSADGSLLRDLKREDLELLLS